MAVSYSNKSFVFILVLDFQRSLLFSVKHATHNKPRILGNKKQTNKQTNKKKNKRKQTNKNTLDLNYFFWGGGGDWMGGVVGVGALVLVIC